MSNGLIDISIIIPVYGVEKYVERCVRSLFEQTLQNNIEFIFVDDKTPDSSFDIINRVLADYPHRSEQVKIIRHENNMGLPFARKTGIMVAQGEYVLNIDSDDWVEVDICERLLTEAKKSQADIVVCDMFIASDTDRQLIHQPVNPQTLLKDMLRCKNRWVLWNKLIRRSLYFEPEIIKFPCEYMAEDMVQSFQLVTRASSIKYCAYPLYNYRSPIFRSFDAEHERRGSASMMRNVEFLIHSLQLNNSEIKDCLRMRAKIMLAPIAEKYHGRSEYLQAYPYLNKKILFNSIVPLRTRLRHLFIVLNISPLANYFVSLISSFRN